MTELSREALIAAGVTAETRKFVFFWGHTPKIPGAIDKSCLSQWWPAKLVVDGDTYASAEHFMMAEKARIMGDLDAKARILKSTDPREVKQIGREVRDYDDKKWGAARFDVVVRGCTAKFGQNPELKSFLLSTGDAVLVEAAPRDTIWGIGLGAENERARDPKTWRGSNLLGFALMTARAALQ